MFVHLVDIQRPLVREPMSTVFTFKSEFASQQNPYPRLLRRDPSHDLQDVKCYEQEDDIDNEACYLNQLASPATIDLATLAHP